MNSTLDSKKIAIVYDWIDKWGGVERILLMLHQLFPTANFYTSYFDPIGAPWAKDLNITTSFIQKLPKFIKKSRIASLFLYPYAFESFDFREYDVVISVTSSFAKSVVTRPETLHLCYLLTPTRYFWSHKNTYVKNPSTKFLTRPLLKNLQKWDFAAAQRPDKIISISRTVQDRCDKYYDRQSNILYPPFDTSYWKSIKAKSVDLPFEKYYLLVSRLESYKCVDLANHAFNEIGKNLVIVGTGTQKNYLKKQAEKNIVFIEGVGDQELVYLYEKAIALIMPQEEDFGYVPLEAQYFGLPTIAYRMGGATETVIDGKTGIFFDRQSVDSLVSAVQEFDKNPLKKIDVKSHGKSNLMKFDRESWKKKFLGELQ